MPNAVVYRGPSMLDGSPIRVIVTGVDRPSENRKTGPMAQVWILADDILPLDAMRTGADAAVCGGCPLAGTNNPDTGRREGRACYVNIGQAPQSVAHTDDRDGYATMSLASARDMLADRQARLGAYGDPAAAPIEVMDALATKGWTGYTHQWRTIDPAWAGLLMASVETLAEREEAHALGYRTFRVTAPGEPPAEREVVCPASRTHNQVRCSDCGACAGTRRGTAPGRVDIVIEAHGSGAKYVG